MLRVLTSAGVLMLVLSAPCMAQAGLMAPDFPELRAVGNRETVDLARVGDLQLPEVFSAGQRPAPW